MSAGGSPPDHPFLFLSRLPNGQAVCHGLPLRAAAEGVEDVPAIPVNRGKLQTEPVFQNAGYMSMELQTDHDGHCHSHPVTEAARNRFRKSPYPTIRNLSCDYDQGLLFLRGRLPSFYHKQLAQVAVAGLEGVAQVVNETEVVAYLLS